jgi:hypothetical protein
MSGNAPKQHWSIRAIAIFVAVVGLIANMIAIIVFVTGRDSLPAFVSTSTPITTLTPMPTLGTLSNLTFPLASSASNPFVAPWAWIWWGFLSILNQDLGYVLFFNHSTLM